MGFYAFSSDGQNSWGVSATYSTCTFSIEDDLVYAYIDFTELYNHNNTNGNWWVYVDNAEFSTDSIVNSRNIKVNLGICSTVDSYPVITTRVRLGSDPQSINDGSFNCPKIYYIEEDPENPPYYPSVSIHVTYYGDTTATNYLGSMTDECASGESFFPFDHNSSVEIPSEYVPHTFVYGTSSNIEYAREGTGDSIHLDGSDSTIYVWVFYTIKPSYHISYTDQFNIGYEDDWVYEGDTYVLPDPSIRYKSFGYRFICWRRNGECYNPGDSSKVYSDMVFRAELQPFTNIAVYIEGDWTEGIAHYWDGNNWKECEINNS